MDYKEIFETIKTKAKSNLKATWVILASVALVFLVIWLSSSYSYNKALKTANKENREKIDSIQKTKAGLILEYEELKKASEAKELQIILTDQKNKQLRTELNKIKDESDTYKSTYFNSSINERVNIWSGLTKGN